MTRTAKDTLVSIATVAAILAAIAIWPVLAIILVNYYAGTAEPVAPDAAFEKELAQIPEVGLFLADHPDHSANRAADFLGWKTAIYRSHGDPAAAVEASKSLLHDGVKVSAGCGYGARGFAPDVPQADVAVFVVRGCGQM